MVVLPAPFAPRIVTMAPAGTDKLAPRMAVIGPYDVSMLLTVRSASAIPYPRAIALDCGSASAIPSPSEVCLDDLGILLDLARGPEGERPAVVEREHAVGD